MKLRLFLATCVLSFLSHSAGAVGFQLVKASDPDDKDLMVGIWYPSDGEVPDKPNSPFQQALAKDAAVRGKDLPLVIMSHGWGGWMGGHSPTALALAEAGFIVAAPTHTGNNYEDESYGLTRVMLDRPRHIQRVIDFMQGQWADRSIIDQNNTAIFGFSVGAYAAVSVSGGVPNPKRMVEYCTDKDEKGCQLVKENDILSPHILNLAASEWGADTRISAAIVIAPGLGFAFDKAGLEKVTVPIQLWAGELDTNVPFAGNTKNLLNLLPQEPEFHHIKKAGHFAFMKQCDPSLEDRNPRIWKMVCVDEPGFDRAKFHLDFNAKVTEFLKTTLRDR